MRRLRWENMEIFCHNVHIGKLLVDHRKVQVTNLRLRIHEVVQLLLDAFKSVSLTHQFITSGDDTGVL